MDVSVIDEIKLAHARRWLKFLLVAILLAGVALRLGFYGDKAFDPDLDHVSMGDPAHLSYTIPDFGRNPDVMVINRTLLPAACVNYGGVKCVEPVADSFYMKNIKTGSNEYRQFIYLKIKNSENEEVIIDRYVFNATGCLFPASGFMLGAKQTSGVIIIVCPSSQNRTPLEGGMTISYAMSGTARQSYSMVRTI